MTAGLCGLGIRIGNVGNLVEDDLRRSSRIDLGRRLHQGEDHAETTLLAKGKKLIAEERDLVVHAVAEVFDEINPAGGDLLAGPVRQS